MAISTPLHAERHHRVRPSTLILPSVAILALAVALIALTHSSLFDVRGIEVHGASHLSSAEVTSAAGIAAGTSTIWLDEEAVERRLEAEPWIGDATVISVWPHTVRIAIEERRPIAVAVEAGERTLVAADGTVLGEADRGASLVEIVVSDAAGSGDDDVGGWVGGAAEAVGALDRRLADRLERVVVAEGGAIELRFSGGIVVRYGAGEDAARKASALAEILRWAERSVPPVARVTLIGPEAPAVTFGA